MRLEAAAALLQYSPGRPLTPDAVEFITMETPPREALATYLGGHDVAAEPPTAEQAVALLRENATRLEALTRGVPAERLHASPGPDAWSPNDVLAHIRACCDVWGGNIARILAEDHPKFAGMSPRTWMKRTDYPDWRFAEALRAFMAQREELLRTLEALMPDDWERTATVTSYGQSNERTLRSYAWQLAEHERSHGAANRSHTQP